MAADVVNFVENGSFEDIGDETIANNGWKPFQEINGWTLESGSAFEIHDSGHGGAEATDGQYWLDLEASPGHIEIAQRIEGLIDGIEYELSFDAINRGDDENGAFVLWNGEEVAELGPDTKTYILDLIAGSGDGSNKLTFVNADETPDNVGLAIDNVVLTNAAVPFDGSAQLYQIHGFADEQGQLSVINLEEETFTDVGEHAGFKINATGYRVADNFIYGLKVQTDELVRISADGSVKNLGSIGGLPNRNYYSGDFGGDGLLYIWSNTTLYGINVDTQVVEREVELSRRMGSTPDVAFDPVSELMYGVEKTGSNRRSFVSVDWRTGHVESISSNFEPKNGTFGAMFADANGRVFASNNKGGLYEVDKATGEATFVGYSPKASSNDGSSPSSAVVNLPPVLENAWVSAQKGASSIPLNLGVPVDSEGDDITVTVTQLPFAGSVRHNGGSVLQIGEEISNDQLQNLLYDAPDNFDWDTEGQLVFELSDGVSSSQTKVDFKVSGNARLTGYVNILHDGDDDTFAGYGFNNEVLLTGVTADGQQVSVMTVTDEYGYYEFTDLEPGSYKVEQHQPIIVFEAGAEAGNLGGTIGVNEISEIIIPEGRAESYDGYNFFEHAPSSVSGFTYVDDDADDTLDSMEHGVRNIQVTLTGTDDEGNDVSRTTITNVYGFYKFEGLRPGSYSVVQTQSEKFMDGASNVGSQGGTSSVNQLSDIELGSGVVATHYDFGEVETATLSGHVFLDNDFDKVLDRDDGFLEGVTITLIGTDQMGKDVERTTTTNEAGEYTFEDIIPGTYSLIQTQPEGNHIVDSRENLGNFKGRPEPIARNGIAGQDQFTEIEIKHGEDGVGYDFAETVQYILAKDFDNTLEIVGTPADDEFHFIAGDIQHEVILNGDSIFLDATKVHDVKFTGNGGNDVAYLTGSTAVEQVKLWANSGSLHGEFFQIQTFETSEIHTYTGGGYDRAFLYDTAGDERVKMTESYARMTGDGWENQANGYHRSYAYASEGEDRAYFHDSKKDDSFKASETKARMFSRKFYNLAQGFDRTYAYATSGGQDTADFWDSAADEDIFEAHPTYARMFNDNFYNQGTGFEIVKAHANTGGENDRAYLHDSEGDEILVSSPSKSGISGDGFEYQVSSFERMYAFASGGHDRAYLYDSMLDDRLLAYSDNVRLYNDDYFLRANNFDQVDAYSSEGGNDRAYFFDSAGDDTLVALENEVRMFGDGFDNTSHGFSRAYAWSENGGNDTAFLYDTKLADTVKIDEGSTRMYGDGYYTRVSDFGTVNTHFSEVTNHDRAAVFGTVGQETMDSAGKLSKVISEYGANYVENADAFYGGVGNGSNDDGDAGNTSDEFSFVPEKVG